MGRQPRTATVATVGGIQLMSRQLPAAPGRLLSREPELGLLDRVIGSGVARVLAIEGPDGVGKTTLVLHWLHRNLRRFPDGELYADVCGRDPTSVLHDFLLALGVRADAVPAGQDARVALYRSLLAGRRMVVVLDNAVDAVQVEPLLPSSHTCQTILTSEAHLGGLVRYGADTLGLDLLSEPSARELLARLLGDQALDEEPEAAASILVSCAGLPLALAIIASCVPRHMDRPLATIADELRTERSLVGEHTVGPRTVVSWAASVLEDRLARVFWLLSTSPSAEVGVPAVASLTALSVPETTSALRELERRNLVHHTRAGRYAMHSLVRRHAMEQVLRRHPVSDQDHALRRLVDFYLHTAYAADRQLCPHRAAVRLEQPAAGCRPLDFDSIAAAVDWFTAEHRNIIDVQRRAMERHWWRQAWQLARALETFQYQQGLLADNVVTSGLGVTAAEQLADRAALALAYRQLGRAHTRAGELAEALPCLRRALGLTAASDPLGRAHCAHDLARAMAGQGDHVGAADELSDAIGWYRQAGNPVGEAHALNALGRCHGQLGQYEQARACGERALALHKRHGNRSGQAVALDNLGSVAMREGHPAESIELYRRAIVLCGEIGDGYFEAACTEHLGSALAADSRIAGARDAWRSAHSRYTVQHRGADADRVRHLLTRLYPGESR